MLLSTLVFLLKEFAMNGKTEEERKGHQEDLFNGGFSNKLQTEA